MQVERVRVHHLISHFINHAINDNLGIIANAWLGHADKARHDNQNIANNK